MLSEKRKKYNYRSYLQFLIILFLVMSVFPITVYADMGPKPKITIRVANPPEGEYYLDLLVKDEGTYDNLKEDRAGYDQTKLALLEAYYSGGWHPGLTKGTGAPLFGKLTGIAESEKMIHSFSYMGVPGDFKLILVTPDNQIVVSEEIHKNAFDFTLDYDYLTGDIRIEKLPDSYLKQYLSTCIPTLFLEGIVLLLFGFSLKKNWKPFVGINVITQIFLTAAASVFITEGQVTGYLVIIPVEILIVLVEMLAFSILLTQHSKLRRIVFAITANLFSFLIGCALLFTS